MKRLKMQGIWKWTWACTIQAHCEHSLLGFMDLLSCLSWIKNSIWGHICNKHLIFTKRNMWKMHYYVLFKLLVNTKRISIVGDLWEDNNKFVMPMKCKEFNFAISKRGYHGWHKWSVSLGNQGNEWGEVYKWGCMFWF